MLNLLPNEHELTIRHDSCLFGGSFLVILEMTLIMTINSNSGLLMRVASAGQYESFEYVQTLCVPSKNNFCSCLCALKNLVIVFVAQLTCCILVILTYTMSFVHVTFQTNRVWMWHDREEENRIIFLLFPCYTRKFREWFTLLFALLVVPILVHTCWVRTFSCLSRERTVHYTIVLIPTVFVPYALVSNSYLVTIFSIHIILEKFEFTSHAHSWSFANIIVLCQLGSVHVVFLFYYYRETTELKWKIYMIHPFRNKNWCEFQNVYICPCSAVDLAQWDLGITVIISSINKL